MRLFFSDLRVADVVMVGHRFLGGGRVGGVGRWIGVVLQHQSTCPPVVMLGCVLDVVLLDFCIIGLCCWGRG